MVIYMSKKTTIIVAAIAAFVLGLVIYFFTSHKPVVDERLVGTWQISSSGYINYTETWTFRKDGTFDRITNGSGLLADGINMDNWYYRAEDGKLKTSPSKNFDGAYSWASVSTYEYQFGISETGTQCLILALLHSDGHNDTTLLYKIN